MRACSISASSSGSRRSRPTTAITSPRTPPRTTRRCCASRPVRRCRDPTRFKFDGDGYYLKSAAEMRAIWDDEVPGACDNTAAHRRARAALRRRVGAPRPDADLPGPRGPRRRPAGCARRSCDGLDRRFPDGPPQEYLARADYEIDVICEMGFPAYFLVVGDLINHAQGGRHPRRPRPWFGGRFAGRLRDGHHQHRPDPARSAVRAVPQPRACVDARYRYRLR